jgi:hypothetical protein
VPSPQPQKRNGNDNRRRQTRHHRRRDTHADTHVAAALVYEFLAGHLATAMMSLSSCGQACGAKNSPLGRWHAVTT